jgi:hypothetical protein
MLSKLLSDSQLRGGKRSALFGQFLPDFRRRSVAYNFILADRTVVPLCCQFSTRKLANERAVLAVGNESGFVTLIDTSSPGGTLHLQSPVAGPPDQPRAYMWRGHPDAIFDLRWNTLDQDCTMLTASGDQVVRLWDVERQHPIGTFVGHSGSVKSISFQTQHPCKKYGPPSDSNTFRLIFLPLQFYSPLGVAMATSYSGIVERACAATETTSRIMQGLASLQIPHAAPLPWCAALMPHKSSLAPGPARLPQRVRPSDVTKRVSRPSHFPPTTTIATCSPLVIWTPP